MWPFNKNYKNVAEEPVKETIEDKKGASEIQKMLNRVYFEELIKLEEGNSNPDNHEPEPEISPAEEDNKPLVLTENEKIELKKTIEELKSMLKEEAESKTEDVKKK